MPKPELEADEADRNYAETSNYALERKISRWKARPAPTIARCQPCFPHQGLRGMHPGHPDTPARVRLP